VLSVCYAWVLVYPLFLLGHLVVIRKLIALEAWPYLRAFAAGLGPVVPMVLGLMLLRQLTRGLHLPVLELGAFVGAGLLIYWAYLRWVLGLRFRELVPKRSRAEAAASSE
jgi:hypothetical protein